MFKIPYENEDLVATLKRAALDAYDIDRDAAVQIRKIAMRLAYKEPLTGTLTMFVAMMAGEHDYQHVAGMISEDA
jgi:hypothetical protein